MNLRPFAVDLDRVPRSALVGVFILGLALRVGTVFLFHDFDSPSTWEYGATATNLAAGKGYAGGGWLGPEAPTALNSPGYIVILAAALRWLGPYAYLGLELFQALISALLPLLAFRLGELLFDRRIAVLTFAMAALYPAYVYFPKQITPAILTSFAVAVAVWLVLELPRWQGARPAAAAGLGIGLAILTEGLALPVVVGFALLWRRTIPARALVTTGVFAVLVMLPWTGRNYLVFQTFVPIKTSFGLNLWLGNNPEATGTIFTADGRPMTETIEPQRAQRLSELNEAQRYQVLQQEAVAWILANPLRFVDLSARRLIYYWWESPVVELEPGLASAPTALYKAQLVLYAPFLGLALLGIWPALRANRRSSIALLWWILSYTLVYAATLPNARRIRLPVELVLLCFASFAVLSLLRIVSRRKSDNIVVT